MLAAIAVLLVSAGCWPWYTASRNIDNSKRLRVGMTKNEVLEVMGEPLSDEIFCKPDCWYYYIEPVWVDGLTTEEECMPLVFEDGKLIGWGRSFFVRYRLERKDATPDLTSSPDLESVLAPGKTSAPASGSTPSSGSAPSAPAQSKDSSAAPAPSASAPSSDPAAAPSAPAPSSDSAAAPSAPAPSNDPAAAPSAPAPLSDSAAAPSAPAPSNDPTPAP